MAACLVAVGSGTSIADGVPRTPRLATAPNAAAPDRGSAPPAGNPHGHVPVPAAARAVDTSHPTAWSAAARRAAARRTRSSRGDPRGGMITFDCGPRPQDDPADRRPRAVRNDRTHRVVIDGGGKITLSGARQAPHPLHEHLRPARSASRRRTARTRRRRGSCCRTSRSSNGNSTGSPPRRRRRRRRLRARRPGQGRQLALLQQPLRRNRPRHRRRRDPRARPVRRPGRLHRAQHVRRRAGLRRGLLERRRPVQHRRLLGRAQQPDQHNRAIGHGANPTRRGDARRRQRRRHLQRRQPLHARSSRAR